MSCLGGISSVLCCLHPQSRPAVFLNVLFWGTCAQEPLVCLGLQVCLASGLHLKVLSWVCCFILEPPPRDITDTLGLHDPGWRWNTASPHLASEKKKKEISYLETMTWFKKKKDFKWNWRQGGIVLRNRNQQQRHLILKLCSTHHSHQDSGLVT